MDISQLYNTTQDEAIGHPITKNAENAITKNA